MEERSIKLIKEDSRYVSIIRLTECSKPENKHYDWVKCTQSELYIEKPSRLISDGISDRKDSLDSILSRLLSNGYVIKEQRNWN
jgi:hypothetical protein